MQCWHGADGNPFELALIYLSITDCKGIRQVEKTVRLLFPWNEEPEAFFLSGSSFVPSAPRQELLPFVLADVNTAIAIIVVGKDIPKAVVNTGQ